MMRESELADMEKKWQADNERIMREHPVGAPVPALDAPAGEDWPEPSADCARRAAISPSRRDRQAARATGPSRRRAGRGRQAAPARRDRPCPPAPPRG